MLEALPCTLIQCYGSSEHVAVTFLSQEDHLAARSPEHRGLLRTCGREAYLTRMRLLDPDRRPVPRTAAPPARSSSAPRPTWRLLAPPGPDGEGDERRLARHGRPGHRRRARLLHGRRPPQGRHRLGRGEHLRGPGRARDRRAAVGARGRRGRRPAPAVGRGGEGLGRPAHRPRGDRGRDPGRGPGTRSAPTRSRRPSSSCASSPRPPAGKVARHDLRGTGRPSERAEACPRARRRRQPPGQAAARPWTRSPRRCTSGTGHGLGALKHMEATTAIMRLQQILVARSTSSCSAST